MTLLQSSSSLRSGQSALRSHRWINGWQVPSVQVNWSSEQAVKVNVVLPSKISHNRSSKSQSKRPVDQFGFLNAKKRTAVAAQATGHVVGQKLRMLNMRTIRLRIDGYNAGRLSSVKGLVQSGTKIVSISDITTIDWGWCQRAKKRKRKNWKSTRKTNKIRTSYWK